MAASARPPSPPPAAAEPVASQRFADAMAALARGDHGRADALLAAFVADFPDDARAEDAAFARAVARARSGDRAGAAVLARDYLRRFPEGLRRREAERLAAP